MVRMNVSSSEFYGIDRYVVFGNHYDAWVFGATDPNSGTAVMMELSRVFAQLVRQGNITQILLCIII
jgi:Zn-dependent M28 family amino/carboxypeptidase